MYEDQYKHLGGLGGASVPMTIKGTMLNYALQPPSALGTFGDKGTKKNTPD